MTLESDAPEASFPRSPISVSMSRNPLAAAASRSVEDVVRFEDVSMRYGHGPDVLSHLNLALAPGSFHFVTGPSGAGKSSLLKLIYLAARPSKGLIHLFGEDVSRSTAETRPQLRRRLGVVI